MAIYSEFSHKKWWFSIAMLVYQRVKDVQILEDVLLQSISVVYLLEWCEKNPVFSTSATVQSMSEWSNARMIKCQILYVYLT